MEGKIATLSCRRCNNTEREQPMPGLCSWCHAAVSPNADPEREREIDRRIVQMQAIHKIELAMDDYQRSAWIESGRRLLGLEVGRGGMERREGERQEGGIGLGPK